MSFFWQSPEMVNALATTIYNNLKVGGLYIFLTIDGDSVTQIFDPPLEGLTSPPYPPKEGPVTLQLGDAHFEYRKGNPPTVFVDIPGTIVSKQTEWPVILDDLILRLPGSALEEIFRAETEKFLSHEEFLYSQIYSFGMMKLQSKPMGEELPVPAVVPREIRAPSPRVPTPRVPTPLTITLPPPTPAPIPIPVPAPIPVPVSSPARSQRLAQDELPSIPEDVVQQMTVSWYKDVIRIGAIGDGSCFIHATLKAFYGPYQENGTYAFRSEFATKFRRDIAYALQLPATAPYEINLVVGPTNEKIDFKTSQVTEEVLQRMRDYGYVTDSPDGAISTPFVPADQDTYDRRVDFGYLTDIGLDPQYPIKINFETAANGVFINFVELQQMAREERAKTGRGEEYILHDRYGRAGAPVGIPIDASIRGLQALFNSARYLGDETYGYVSQLLGMTIYVVRGYYDDVDPYIDTVDVDPAYYEDPVTRKLMKTPDMEPQKCVVIVGNGVHYEVLGLKTEEDTYQTVFEYDDPFIVALEEQKTRGARALGIPPNK